MATILLGGASGFIGSSLARSLVADGHRVARLVRPHTADGSATATAAVDWDPEAGRVDRKQLAQIAPDAIVNLAGAPIAQRWTKEHRRKIRDSRVRGTTALAEAMASLRTKPEVFVSGSAIGYYGAHRGDEVLDESSLPGSDFLGQIGGDWEAATSPASDAGIRVVISRTAVVLGKRGGMLARLLLPFKLGIGGRLANGQHWMSWIAHDDMVRALRFFLDTPTAVGAFNVAAPEPVRNDEFTKTLGRVLHRPTVIPIPKFVLQLLFGKMAEDTILASQRLTSKRLAGAGFDFRHPRLDEALRFELTRSDDRADR